MLIGSLVSRDWLSSTEFAEYRRGDISDCIDEHDPRSWGDNSAPDESESAVAIGMGSE